MIDLVTFFGRGGGPHVSTHLPEYARFIVNSLLFSSYYIFVHRFDKLEYLQ